jgi:hypothetical protein
MSLATAGRDYRVLPDGHPALAAFREFIAQDDGFDALAGLKKFYKLAEPMPQSEVRSPKSEATHLSKAS